VFRLLLPFVSGLLLLVPLQTYIAERFHNQYTGGYFAQYILFFTKPTNLTGYQGGFTPAHLWFILYLFIISLLALPLMRLYQKSAKKLRLDNIPAAALLPLFIIPLLMQIILDIAGKSLGEYFAFFMLGYLVLSDERVLEKLERARWWLLVIMAACMVFLKLFYEQLPVLLLEVLLSFLAWVAVLAILGLGRRYLNFQNKVTAYFSKSSFSIYLFHQQWVVVAAYFTLMITPNVPLQMGIIIASSLTLTFATYEIARRIPVCRLLFGMKG
jgi:peptidoglycan/LPS O-acetylase OafA/YrhL